MIGRPQRDPEPAEPIAEPVTEPPRANAPLHVVYDFAGIAQVLHDGGLGLPGLGSVRTSARQYPLGDPFPVDRWLSKVSHADLKTLSASGIARLLESRLEQYRIGPPLGVGIVAIDEVGADADDTGFGPRLHAAMKLLTRRTYAGTGEKVSRRVIFYAAPKMVANVGEPNDRELWDSTNAAARLSGGGPPYGPDRGPAAWGRCRRRARGCATGIGTPGRAQVTSSSVFSRRRSWGA